MNRFIYIILLTIGLSTALGTYSLRAQTNAAITVLSPTKQYYTDSTKR